MNPQGGKKGTGPTDAKICPGIKTPTHFEVSLYFSVNVITGLEVEIK